MADVASRDVAPGDEELVARDLAHVRRQAASRPPERLRLSEEPETGSEESAAANLLGVDRYGESTGETIDGDESRIARRLRERLERKRKEKQELFGRAAGTAKTSGRVGREYRAIKRVIRVVKLASAVGTSFGDVFVSLATLFLTINGEFIYSKMNPRYPFDTVDKIIFFGGWALILLVLFLLAVLVIIIVELIRSAGPLASFLLN